METVYNRSIAKLYFCTQLMFRECETQKKCDPKVNDKLESSWNMPVPVGREAGHAETSRKIRSLNRKLYPTELKGVKDLRHHDQCPIKDSVSWQTRDVKGGRGTTKRFAEMDNPRPLGFEQSKYAQDIMPCTGTQVLTTESPLIRKS